MPYLYPEFYDAGNNKPSLDYSDNNPYIRAIHRRQEEYRRKQEENRRKQEELKRLQSQSKPTQPTAKPKPKPKPKQVSQPTAKPKPKPKPKQVSQPTAKPKQVSPRTVKKQTNTQTTTQTNTQTTTQTNTKTKEKADEIQKSGFLSTGVGKAVVEKLAKAKTAVSGAYSNHKIPVNILLGTLGAYGIYKLYKMYKLWREKRRIKKLTENYLIDEIINNELNETSYVLNEFSNTVSKFNYLSEDEINTSIKYLSKLFKNSI